MFGERKRHPGPDLGMAQRCTGRYKRVETGPLIQEGCVEEESWLRTENERHQEFLRLRQAHEAVRRLWDPS